MFKSNSQIPRVYGYARISPKGVQRGDKELSCDMQEEMCSKRAESLDGEWVCCFKDHRVSGATVPFLDRQAGASLIRVLRPGDHLIVWKLDRISRKPSDGLKTLDMLAKMDVNVYILNFSGGQSLALTTAIGKMLVEILIVFAGFERNLLRERTSEALQYRKRLGLPINGSARYGYRRETEKDSQGNVIRGSLRYVRDENEIAMIYEMYKRKQRESMRVIHEDWRKRGCTTADGNPWTQDRMYGVWTWYREQVRQRRGAL